MSDCVCEGGTWCDCHISNYSPSTEEHVFPLERSVSPVGQVQL